MNRIIIDENGTQTVEVIGENPNQSLIESISASDLTFNYQNYLGYAPTFQGATQFWLAKNARVGRTISSDKCNSGDSVLAIDLGNPSNGEGGDQLIYSNSGQQPSTQKTPAGTNGSNIIYYRHDGGFVRILNTLNNQLGFKTAINPVKNAPFEYMTAVRINKGIVNYESITSGTFGIKYEGGSTTKIYSNYSGSDSFQTITWNPTSLLDQIIILHFNMTSPTTMSFRISHPSVGDYYQGNANWDVTFPTNKPLQNIVIGTSSHPIIADHFGGVLKSNGSFTTNERAANIAEFKKLFPIDKVYNLPFAQPTLSYASNLFTLALNFKTNAYPLDAIDNSKLLIRWFKYVKTGLPGANAIDDRVLMQEWSYGQFTFKDAGYTGNPLTYNRQLANLPTDATKADIVCDVRYFDGYEYPFVTAPFGSYY